MTSNLHKKVTFCCAGEGGVCCSVSSPSYVALGSGGGVCCSVSSPSYVAPGSGGGVCCSA